MVNLIHEAISNSDEAVSVAEEEIATVHDLLPPDEIKEITDDQDPSQPVDPGVS